jgi:GntR family transcriptional regulator
MYQNPVYPKAAAFTLPRHTTTTMRRHPRGPNGKGVAPQQLATNSPVPLYHRLYTILRERIVNGVARPGDLMPTENELMAAYGVARNTVKRALNDLAADGLVSRARGRGTMVIPNSAVLQMQAPIAANIDDLWPLLSMIGQLTSAELRTYEFIPANTYLAEQLNLPVGAVVQHTARIRRCGDTPFSYSQSFMPESVGRSISPEDLRELPLIELIKRAGIRIHRVRQAITCTVADEIASSSLEVDAGSALLKLRRVYFDDGERAVNYAEILYNPRLFEYRMSWTRGSNDALKLDATTQTSANSPGL